MDYITAREARKISQSNKQALRELEKKRLSVKDSRAEMKNDANLVEFDGLRTYFFTDIGVVKAVDGVSFDIPRGSTVGVVGESGCGKSISSLSLMRLLSKPAGQLVDGEIRFNIGDKAIDLARASNDEMQKIRGNSIAMIFQEPMTSLNPVFRIGTQLDEVLNIHRESLISRGLLKDDSGAVKRRTVEMLERVGIPDAKSVYMRYPHELSGGMRQRVMIAMALLCDPKLIIADEPTTALDVTIQAQILELLRDLKNRSDCSIMLITHDLGVVAEMADFVVVMYAGRVIEKGTAAEIFKDPRHPYTLGLMKSKPTVGERRERLYNIRGSVPSPVDMPNYCFFRDRCDRACEKCGEEYPHEIRLSETHSVSCYLEGGDE